MPHDLIASQDVCERFGIVPSTLSRWVAAGKITPAVKAPGPRGAFLFAREDVEELARKRGAAA